MSIALMILAGGLGVLILLEISLRLLFGFGNPLLYVADPKIGYLLAPNQHTRRFGNQIMVNQYSMRSANITPDRPDRVVRVLLLGDSIANGGWWTDQSDTISAVLQRQLKLDITGIERVEVLNASASSWGPRNELAYLQRFGSFDSQVIILLLNTDDLFAPAPSSIKVGRDRNYPSHKPPLALAEMISRYFAKANLDTSLEDARREEGDRVSLNLDAIYQIQQFATQSDARFVLAITPLFREIGEPGSRNYEKAARKQLRELVQQHRIAFVDFLPIFNKAADPQTFYRDTIHLSPQGNHQITRSIARMVEQVLNSEN